MIYNDIVVHKNHRQGLTTRPAGIIVEPTDADIERGHHIHGAGIDNMVLVHWAPAGNWVTTWEYESDLEPWTGSW